MTVHEFPKSSKLGFYFILIILILGVGWLYFRDSLPPEARSAFAAKEEMLQWKNEAESAKTVVKSESSLNEALNYEKEGDSDFAGGKYVSAKISYNTAKDLFVRSIKGELVNNSDPSTNSRGGSSPQDMEGSKPPKEEIFKEKKEAILLRDEMIKAKQIAEDLSSKTSAKNTWGKAEEKRRLGDNQFVLDTKNSFLAAIKLYKEARNLYMTAKEEVAKAKAVDTKQKEVVEPLAKKIDEKTENISPENKKPKLEEEIEKDNSKDEMNNSRNEMNNVKRSILWSDEEKKENESYISAKKNEQAGDNARDQGDYIKAAESYRKAGILYGKANDEIKDELKSRAVLEFKALMSSFEQDYENEMLNSLVEKYKIIPKTEIKSWEFFFKDIKNIKVENITALDEEFNLEEGAAKYLFKCDIEYKNRTNGKIVNETFKINWELKFENEKWRVISGSMIKI